jgi:hypothetical protein
MFTWEEAGLLRQLLLVVKWLLIVLAAAVAVWLATRL